MDKEHRRVAARQDSMPGKSPVAEESTFVALKPLPDKARHGGARTIVQVARLAVTTVRKIRKAHAPPNRRWQFKPSDKPVFTEKPHDAVGLYFGPLRTVVLSIDEKPQIQALDQTRSGSALKKGRVPTMAPDCKRDHMTTVTVALNVLASKAFGRNMQRHRHQGLIRRFIVLEHDILAGTISPIPIAIRTITPREARDGADLILSLPPPAADSSSSR